MAASGTEEAVCLISNVTHSLMENDVENKLNVHSEQQQHQQDEIEDEVEDEEVSSSLDSEIGDALDLLDSKDEDVGYSFFLNSRRPNSHGGHHHYFSTLQPRTNRNQRFSNRIRASPLEVGFLTYLFIPFHSCWKYKNEYKSHIKSCMEI